MTELEHYQFAYSVYDLSPLNAERALVYLMRGVAACLLAPIELLQYMQRARRVERSTALSWIVSLAMYFCALPIMRGILTAATVFSACMVIALALANGLLQRLRSIEVERSVMMEYLERVA